VYEGNLRAFLFLKKADAKSPRQQQESLDFLAGCKGFDPTAKSPLLLRLRWATVKRDLTLYCKINPGNKTVAVKKKHGKSYHSGF